MPIFALSSLKTYWYNRTFDNFRIYLAIVMLNVAVFGQHIFIYNDVKYYIVV